jgi:hypothetical protein
MEWGGNRLRGRTGGARSGLAAARSLPVSRPVGFVKRNLLPLTPGWIAYEGDRAGSPAPSGRTRPDFRASSCRRHSLKPNSPGFQGEFATKVASSSQIRPDSRASSRRRHSLKPNSPGFQGEFATKADPSSRSTGAQRGAATSGSFRQQGERTPLGARTRELESPAEPPPFLASAGSSRTAARRRVRCDVHTDFVAPSTTANARALVCKAGMTNQRPGVGSVAGAARRGAKTNAWALVR